jgi:hypothetical protein
MILAYDLWQFTILDYRRPACTVPQAHVSGAALLAAQSKDGLAKATFVF